jgi:hypothetical protein
MLSEKKWLLRTAELLAILGALASLLVALRSYRYPDPDFPIFLAASGGMALLMLTFLPACMLSGEYVRTVRLATSWRQRVDGLNASELKALVRWAPKLYLVAAAAGVFIAVAVAITFGGVTISDSQPARPSDVVAVALSFAAFHLFALPLLGSAARMPGAYAEQNDA